VAHAPSSDGPSADLVVGPSDRDRGAFACACLVHFLENPIRHSKRLDRDGVAVALMLLICVGCFVGRDALVGTWRTCPDAFSDRCTSRLGGYQHVIDVADGARDVGGDDVLAT